MIKYVGIISILLLLSGAAYSQQAITRVTYPDGLGDNDSRQKYFTALLDLALKHSESEYGPYELIISDKVLPSGRVPQMMLKSELVSVMSSPETESLNSTLLRVPVPLLMGVQGLRLSFIHQDNKTLFENTHELQSLKQVIFSQGIDWIDSKILVNNGLKVQTATIYESLFGMISQKRAHAFPRGLNEIYQELEVWKTEYPTLSIDQHIAPYYPLPVAFYVNPNNPALKERILLGLNNAKDNGEFDELFSQYFSDVIDKSNLDKRKIFILNNPYKPSQYGPEYKRHLMPVLQALLQDN